MSTTYPVSRIWRSPPDNLPSLLGTCIPRFLKRRSVQNPVRVFFRADDIGVPGKQFTRLIDIFARHKAPLCLAVVPVWLTPARWSAILNICRKTPFLWCWHQHGWRHKNYEKQLKKQEFGPSRPAADVKQDLVRGQQRLASIMGTHLYPIFTPPWNRCSADTLHLLKQLDFHAVSRAIGAKPRVPEGLCDIPVHIDLHTRRDRHSEDGWQKLFLELGDALAGDICGIMIHHQRMNDAAFHFMDSLLKILSKSNPCQLVSMTDLVQEK